MIKTNINLGELKFESLGDKAANHIRSKIVRQNYPAGMKLPEQSFASSLGVSRACIREAFMILEAEGLVKRVRNKYTEVVNFTQKDIEEIKDIRRTIEILCAETCIKKEICPIKELEKQIAIIDSLNDIESIMEADLNFHEIIVRASGNDRALSIWLRLKGQMMVLLYTSIENKANLYKTHTIEIHKAVVNALKAKSLEMASEQLSREINQTSL